MTMRNRKLFLLSAKHWALHGEHRLIAVDPPPNFAEEERLGSEASAAEALEGRRGSVQKRAKSVGERASMEGKGENESIAARAEMQVKLEKAFQTNGANTLQKYFRKWKDRGLDLAPSTASSYSMQLKKRMDELSAEDMFKFGVSEESGPVVIAANSIFLQQAIETLRSGAKTWERPLLGALEDYQNVQKSLRNAVVNPNSLADLVSSKNANWIRLYPKELENAAINAVKTDPASMKYIKNYANLWPNDGEDVYSRIVEAAIAAGKIDVIFYASSDWKKVNKEKYREICVDAAETQNPVRVLQLISGDEFAKYWKESLSNNRGKAKGAYVDIAISALKANPTLAFTLIHGDLKRMGTPFYKAVVQGAPTAVAVLFENTSTTAFKDYEFVDGGKTYRGFEAALREIAGTDPAKAVITIFGNPSLLKTVRSKCPLFYKELFDKIVKFDDPEIISFIERHGIADENFIEKFVEAMLDKQNDWIATYPNLMRTIPDAMYKQAGVRPKLLELFKNKGQLLAYAPYEVRNDKDFVLQVVMANADAFANASLGLRDDADVLLAAVNAEKGGAGNVHWADIGPTLQAKLGSTPLEGAELLRRVLGLPEETPELTSDTVTSGLDNFTDVQREDAEMVLAYLETPGAKDKPTYIVDVGEKLKNDPVFVAQAIRIDPRYFLYLGSAAREVLKNDPNYTVWFKKVLEIDIGALKAVPLSVLTHELIVQMTPNDLAKRKAFFRAIPEAKLNIDFANAVVNALTSRGQQAVDEFIEVLPEEIRSAIQLDFSQITPDKLPNEMYNAELIKKITNMYDMDKPDAAALEMMTTWVAYAIRINKNLYAVVPVALRNNPAFVVAMLEKSIDSTLIFSNISDLTLVNSAFFDALVASSAKFANLLNLRVALRSASPALRTQFMQQCVGHDGFLDIFAFAGNLDLIPDAALDQNIFNDIVGTYPHMELFEKAGKKPEGIIWIVAYLRINPALWSVVQKCDPALVDKVRKSMTPAELSQDAQKANEATLSRVNHQSNMEGLKNYAIWTEVLGLIEIGRMQDVVLPPHGDHGGNITVCNAYNYLAQKAQQKNGLPQREIEQLRALILARINVSAVTITELQTRAPAENMNFFVQLGVQLGYVKMLKSMLWSLNPNTRAWTDQFIRDRVSAQFDRLPGISKPQDLALEIDLTLEAISGYDTWGLNSTTKQFYTKLQEQLLKMRKQTWEKITVPGKPVIQKKEPPAPDLFTDLPEPPESTESLDPVVKGAPSSGPLPKDARPSFLEEVANRMEVQQQMLWVNMRNFLKSTSTDPISISGTDTFPKIKNFQEHLRVHSDDPKTLLQTLCSGNNENYPALEFNDGKAYTLVWTGSAEDGHIDIVKKS